MAGPGKTMVGFVYAGEMFSEEYRSIVGSAILFTDSATMLLLPLYFKLISKNWLYFQLFYFILSVISCIFLFFIPESPKYLLSKGLNDRAQQSFEKIAKINGVQNFHMQLNIEEVKDKAEQQKGTLKELIKNSTHFKNLLISIFLWSACLASYFSIYFHLRYLPGDLFLNNMVFAGCEVTAYAIGTFITKKIGIKPSYVCGFMLPVLSTIAYLFIRNSEGL